MHSFKPAAGLIVLAAGAVWTATAEPVPSLSSPAPDGRQVFLESRCQNCHAVSSAGLEAKARSERLRGPDLVDVGQRHDRDWIGGYLRRKTKLNGKTHKLNFKGSDEELSALIDWLLEQKSE